MKHKDIEAKIPTMFIFGEYPNGNVDLSCGEDYSYIENIPIPLAEKLIKDRQEIINLLFELSEKIDSAFDEAWYEL